MTMAIKGTFLQKLKLWKYFSKMRENCPMCFWFVFYLAEVKPRRQCKRWLNTGSPRDEEASCLLPSSPIKLPSQKPTNRALWLVAVKTECLTVRQDCVRKTQGNKDVEMVSCWNVNSFCKKIFSVLPASVPDCKQLTSTFPWEIPFSLRWPVR